MVQNVGIRREDLYAWERRTPLIPEHLRELSREEGIPFVVQSSLKRIFTDVEYEAAGLPVRDDLCDCPVVIGLKEIPVDVLRRSTTYAFFSHTIKGQPANMPMLQRCLDLGCTVIDYERIVDDEGRRLVYFGNYAGLAGMIDTLWALGRRLAWERIETPFAEILQASAYPDLSAAKAAIRRAGERIADAGLPRELSPLVIGVVGYGNVSRGAQEILDLLPMVDVSPSDLLNDRPLDRRTGILKVVFREADTVAPLDPARPFDLAEYYEHPERYRGAFSRYLPRLHVLVNCTYWEPKYPRLVTKAHVAELFSEDRPALRVIGDISCDVEGAVECTIQTTEPDDPVYVYEPAGDRALLGVEGDGPVVLAVDILPSELPREASAFFSEILRRFVPALARADYSAELADLALPAPLRRATIVHRGRLTPDYRYLERHLGRAEGVRRSAA